MSIIRLVESLLENISSLFEDKIELIKLKVIEKLSRIITSIITAFLLSLFFLVFIIVFNIGIALLIGNITGKSYLGFLIVSAFYAIIGFLLFVYRRKIMKGIIINRIIKKITEYGSSNYK